MSGPSTSGQPFSKQISNVEVLPADAQIHGILTRWEKPASLSSLFS
jgi:hypothetical protein